MSIYFEKFDQLIKTLELYIYRDTIPLETWQICEKLGDETVIPEVDDPIWRQLQPDELWGAHMSRAWLMSDVVIPDNFKGKPVVLRLVFEPIPREASGMMLSDPEALVILRGMNVPPQAINEGHSEIWLAECAKPGPIHVVIDCFCGISQPDHQVRLKVAELVWIDRAVEAFYWDARVLLDTAAVLPVDALERSDYLRALDEAFQQVNWLNPPDEAFLESVSAARSQLQNYVYSQPIHDHSLMAHAIVHALGHAHLDLAWLWTLQVTRGKAQRTFSTAVALMEQFPAYTFTQSQPYLYKIVAEDAPELFERIKERIAAEQWNATGSTWVEMDTNLPAGESLVRQFLFGMRYFERELNVRPEVLWLPDGFGFNAALPQMMQQAGVRYFFTNKLSWNDHVKMPYDTFWWEGLDGSRVLAHLGTTPETRWDVGREKNYTTYVAVMTPEEISGTMKRYRQKEMNRHLMVAYGYGDGGGGPNRSMLERRTRMENLSGLTQVVHSTAEKFFHGLEDNVAGNLPCWVGELYLQFHRGTYTTQARTKRLNRKTEILLHDTEALASLLYLLRSAYPQNCLNAAWETVLLNQFHDILPGSSIREVHAEAEHTYAQAIETLCTLINQTLETLSQQISSDPDLPGFAVFNTIAVDVGGPVEVTLPPGSDTGEIIDIQGRVFPHQWLDEKKRRALFVPDPIPGYGYKGYRLQPALQVGTIPDDQAVFATPTLLKNNLLQAEFDDLGQLIRLYDRENSRDVLELGASGNQLWAFVDRPHEFDAWEVTAYSQDQGWQLKAESCKIIENGPVRAMLEVTYLFNKSKIVQRISLIAGQRLLRFDTDVDWHEQHLMLKTLFPLEIRTMNTTYEIQFGTVERPNHRNTIWDQAQFEVPAQQWADMSEAGYGVSLINDCKYGYSARNNIIMLSLLRSPTQPDPKADQGFHQFTYALYPHAGDWRTGTIAQAKRLNHPLRATPLAGTGNLLPDEFSLVKCPTPGTVIDTVKKAEDSDALIVRIYEGQGGRTKTNLEFGMPIEAAEEVNILEETIGLVDRKANQIHFDLKPYQIRTFKVWLGKPIPNVG